MEEKEILERILSLEFEQKAISKQLDKIENTLVSLNTNVSSFTQELTLLKANTHNKEECKTIIIKEVKTDIYESFKRTGQATMAIGAAIGFIGYWLKTWLGGNS